MTCEGEKREETIDDDLLIDFFISFSSFSLIEMSYFQTDFY